MRVCVQMKGERHTTTLYLYTHMDVVVVFALILVFRISLNIPVWHEIYITNISLLPIKPRSRTNIAGNRNDVGSGNLNKILEWLNKVTIIQCMFLHTQVFETPWRDLLSSLSLWHREGGCERCYFFCVYKSLMATFTFPQPSFSVKQIHCQWKVSVREL